MKIAMISQPMNGLSQSEIEKRRYVAIGKLDSAGYEIVNTYFKDEDIKMGNDVINEPLFYLSKLLEKMAECNTLYLLKGWENARGCRLEKAAAEAYGLKIIEEKEYLTL